MIYELDAETVEKKETGNTDSGGEKNQNKTGIRTKIGKENAVGNGAGNEIGNKTKTSSKKENESNPMS